MKIYIEDRAGTVFNVILLIAVYAGVQHFTHHNCIAVSAVAALMFLKTNLENR